MQNEDPNLQHELIRINARAWGVSFGLLSGLGILIATNVLVLKGGENVGHHLGRLGNVLPGYDVTFQGSLIGFVYLFVVGYALGRLLSPKRPVPTAEARELLASRHPPIHGHVWGLALGVMAGGGLGALTAGLVVRGGDNVGELLGRLAIFLPGYTVTWPGALVGTLYLLVIGYAIGRVVAGLYNRTVALLG